VSNPSQSVVARLAVDQSQANETRERVMQKRDGDVKIDSVDNKPRCPTKFHCRDLDRSVRCPKTAAAKIPHG